MIVSTQARRTLNSELSQRRRAIASESVELFARVYLPHYFSLPFSSMHHEIFALLDEASERRGRKIAIAAPRGHAKSTCVSLAYVLYAVLCRKERYVLIVSATKELACLLLRHVKVEMESNSLIHEDFPEADPMRNARPKPWCMNQMSLPNGSFVHALGVGQQVRGVRHLEYRPSLIIADDLESPDGVISGVQRDKTSQWFDKTLLNTGEVGTNVVVVGTVLHYDSLLAKLLDKKRSPGWSRLRLKALIREPERTELWSAWELILNDCDDELWEGKAGPDAAEAFYRAHHDEMNLGAEVLWPERESLYDLMEMRVCRGRSCFGSEKQNEPLDPDKCLFKAELFTFWDDTFDDADALLKSLGKEAMIHGAWDPCVASPGRQSDFSAIVIVAKNRGDNTSYVIVADIARWTPTEAIDRIIEYAHLYRISKFVVEDNGFQKQLLEQTRRVAASKGLSMSVNGVTNTSNKTTRINLLEPSVTQGRIRFCKKHLVLLDQLRQFPLASHDDGPDALHMAVNIKRSNVPSATGLSRRGSGSDRQIDWLHT